MNLHDDADFAAAQSWLLERMADGKLSQTWREMSVGKAGMLHLLPVFWLTPLSTGFGGAGVCHVGIPCAADEYLQPSFAWLPKLAGVYDEVFDRHAADPHPLFHEQLGFQGIIQLSVYNKRKFGITTSMARFLYDAVKDMPFMDFERRPEAKPVGAMTFEEMDGMALNGPTLKFLYQYCSLRRYVTDPVGERWRVLEIGGGFGGFCRQFLSNHPETTYVIIDIPETMIVSSYFLRTFFPEKRIKLHTDPAVPLDLDAADVHFVLAENSAVVSGMHFDLAVNSHSLLEMNRADIEKYFRLLQSDNRVEHFYNFNRTSRPENDGIARFEDMPYDDGWEYPIDQTAPGDFFAIYPQIERLSRRA